MFSLAVLLYGDYPELARRVLGSIRDSRPPASLVADLRIGLNAVSPATEQVVRELCACQLRHLPCHVYRPPANAGKYPLMRRMFYDPKCPLADRVMWFDDDSHLEPSCDAAWWQTISRRSRSVIGAGGVLGKVYTILQRGNQHLGIRQQPWYAGKPVGPRHRFRFATGGWWVAETAFLHRWDYPFPDLFHNGGDSILGELVRQQSAQLLDYHAGVRINVGGRKGRRGIGVALRNEVYVWQDYQPGLPWDLSHQAFPCTVERYAPCQGL